jgi:hypothetical protein
MFGLETKELLIYGGAGLGGLVLLLVLLKLLGGGKKKGHKDLEKAQREYLDEYPPAPPSKGGKRLVIDGVDVRLRLVVVAPAGSQNKVDADEVPELLDDLLRGLAAFVKSDKPRIRVWPAVLSVAGFAPSFFRLVESPEEEGQRSHWVRVAGPIKIGGKPYLLGLALYAEEANKLGSLDLQPTEWAKHLGIEK